VTALRAASTRGARARLKMKDLERATGVGRESIRFYIREGLLPEPQRPGRNVAWYDQSFVERIRLIKELQHERFLPLSVIKTIVGGHVPPSASEVQALVALDGKLPQVKDAALESADERLSTLAARTGIGVREIKELAATDALVIVTRDGDQWVEGAAVRLVELWARFRAAGFTPERNFRAEQVRLYVDMGRWLAREELRLFTKGLAGRVDADELARMAEAGIEIGSEVLALLRRAALLRFIAQGNLADAEAPGVKQSSARGA
jgi:DNA-binding transcriptional MerR regulator